MAAISVVAFNGIRDRAVDSMLRGDLAAAARVLEADKVVLGEYPATQQLANDGDGLPASKGVTYQYDPVNVSYDKRTIVYAERII